MNERLRHALELATQAKELLAEACTIVSNEERALLSQDGEKALLEQTLSDRQAAGKLVTSKLLLLDEIATEGKEIKGGIASIAKSAEVLGYTCPLLYKELLDPQRRLNLEPKASGIDSVTFTAPGMEPVTLTGDVTGVLKKATEKLKRGAKK
jgi:hypothetical protein